MTTDERLGLLHFSEGYFERIWGGQKLRTLLGKACPSDKPIGEAWLIADHAVHESVVDEGPLTGQTLRQLVEKEPGAILGSRAALTVHGRFPLLLKILDAKDVLSVQVHPDDECAMRLGEPDVGKTEMWHVLQAEPESELICGLDAACTPDVFERAVHDGSVEAYMKRIPVRESTSVFVPAGAVHAIGAGILLAEIQQNSDLTYRIYDWGRLQADGTPRELHVEKALKAVHFGSVHRGAANGLEYRDGDAMRTVLAACRYFAAEDVSVSGTFTRSTRGESFHILLAKTPNLSVTAGNVRRSLNCGEAVFVPGMLGQFIIEGEGTFLDYFVPDLARDIVAPLRGHGYDERQLAALGVGLEGVE